MYSNLHLPCAFLVVANLQNIIQDQIQTLSSGGGGGGGSSSANSAVPAVTSTSTPSVQPPVTVPTNPSEYSGEISQKNTKNNGVTGEPASSSSSSSSICQNSVIISCKILPSKRGMYTTEYW